MSAFSERDITARDAPWIVALITAPHARPYMQPPDEAAVRASLGRAENAERIVLDAAGAPVAVWRASLEDDWIAEIRTLAAATPGTGAGTWALRRALAWVFDERGVHRVYLYVVAANVRARALYERHGLLCEGTQRDAFRTAAGTFEDLCVYGMLDREYATRRWSRPDLEHPAR